MGSKTEWLDGRDVEGPLGRCAAAQCCRHIHTQGIVSRVARRGASTRICSSGKRCPWDTSKECFTSRDERSQRACQYSGGQPTFNCPPIELSPTNPSSRNATTSKDHKNIDHKGDESCGVKPVKFDAYPLAGTFYPWVLARVRFNVALQAQAFSFSET